MWRTTESKMRTRMTVQGHDDDNMQDDHDEDEVLEDNGCGQEEEEEEEEEEQHPFQEDHVDVTTWLDLLDRSITPPLPRES